MKKVLAVVLAAAFVCIGAYHADAQVPLMKVVFDNDFGKDSKDCPGPGLDQIAIIGSNFNTYLGAIEFGVQFPPSLAWVADTYIPNKVVADDALSPGALTIAFGNNPVNAFSTAVIHRMEVFWQCVACGGPQDELVVVVPNGITGFLQGAVWPTGVLFPVLGGTSVVCPTPVPTTEQTWGQIKSLYSE